MKSYKLVLLKLTEKIIIHLKLLNLLALVFILKKK